MTRLTELETRALSELRSHVESRMGEFGSVYLSNCSLSDENPKAWSGVLGSLKKKGLYADVRDPEYKGLFGYVKVSD